MLSLSNQLSSILSDYLSSKYNIFIDSFDFHSTRKEFEGDITLVIFPLLNHLKEKPEIISNDLGQFLLNTTSLVINFNVIKGFLNLSISDSFYLQCINNSISKDDYGFKNVNDKSKTVIVEFSSPNTNKPLHLGHIRNNLLGYSISKILEANGNKVIKTQIINDRGIHICKSMIAWKLYGNQLTPEKSKIKGDRFVGDYYVLFDQKYKEEINLLIKKGLSQESAKADAPILKKAQELLFKWESGDKEIISLWEKMNSWVYKGFETTYEKLGVDFDSYYYESKTYLLGKEIIKEGLSKNIFFIKKDGSIWIDLSSEGLDEKLLLRSDGTSVYITQDLGTAVQRYKDNPSLHGMVYTVGNEQDYHFKVLFLILKKLGYNWSESLYHLSYGMVDLPQGKMKSREGTVVDADDLILEMRNTAQKISENLGKLESLSIEEKNKLYDSIGLGALKYFILKVDPKKRILFDPEKSIDFSGNTGPFIQYTHARIKSILRKSSENFDIVSVDIKLNSREKELIKQLQTFPEIVNQASNFLSPALIANYLYELVKTFNSFYQNINILGEKNEELKKMKVMLTLVTGKNIKRACSLLGIQVPERM